MEQGIYKTKNKNKKVQKAKKKIVLFSKFYIPFF